MAHTNRSPGEGGRGSVKSLETSPLSHWNGGRQHRGCKGKQPVFGKVKFLELWMADLKFGFQLEDPGGLFGAAVFVGSRFFTTALICCQFLFGAAIAAFASKYMRLGVAYALFQMARLLREVKRNPGFAQTIAINLLHAYAHGSAQQRCHPKPHEI